MQKSKCDKIQFLLIEKEENLRTDEENEAIREHLKVCSLCNIFQDT